MTTHHHSLQSKWASNTAIILFIALVGITAYLSVEFQRPIRNEHEIIEQTKLFNSKELEKIVRLTLKNKSGEYIFERSRISQGPAWHMMSPKSLSASSFFIDQLFSSLNIIKTKNLMPDNQINNSNFSLNKPTAVLTLTDENNKNIIINVGIMNTIDNTTYLKIVGREGILRVEAPAISLENATLQDLIESRIFDLNFNQLSSFRLFRKNSTVPQFKVSLNEGVWMSEENRPLDTGKLQDILEDFNNLRSSFLLDKQSDAQNKQTFNLTSSPDYIIKILTIEGKEITYNVALIPKNLIDVDLKNEPYFIVTSSEGQLAYVVKQEMLKFFDLKNETIKSLETIK